MLLDSERVSWKRRFKNLLRNVRRNGWRYIPFRIFEATRAVTYTAVVNAAVGHGEVVNILREAFPERSFSLPELAGKFGFSIRAVGNLNGAEAVKVLQECSADLGVVLGTRILKSGTFRVLRMGCINLHKGKVPEYRGGSPGFWELYDGISTAGVTVHFVDEGLDTGETVTTSEIPILPTHTPDSLLEKLHQEGARVLASAVAAIQAGRAIPRKQSGPAIRPRTRPTIADLDLLRRKLPHWKPRNSVFAVMKNLYCLFVYYSGLYTLVRLLHRRKKSRAAIFLYHRVNDYSKDVLTVDLETFAAHLLAVSKRYAFSSTAGLVDCIRNHKPIQPTRVAIHFDDCYRDILTNGAPVLRVLGIPAAAFINSGYVDTDRSFPHDVEKCPFTYQMLRSCDVREWANLGFEAGAHTVNRVDLGRCAPQVANSEIVQCGGRLQEIIGKPVNLFSFPFGRVHNFSAEAMRFISEAGYVALSSAHGGFIGERTTPYDIPRMGVSSEASPLYVLLEIEGLAPSQIASALRSGGSRVRRKRP